MWLHLSGELVAEWGLALREGVLRRSYVTGH